MFIDDQHSSSGSISVFPIKCNMDSVLSLYECEDATCDFVQGSTYHYTTIPGEWFEQFNIP